MPNLREVAGGLEILYGVAAVILAFVVYFAAPRRPENRILAVLLFIDGLGAGGIAIGIARFYLGHMPAAIESGVGGLQYVTLVVRPFLYLLFIGYALRGRPAAWARHRIVRTLAVIAMVASFAAILWTAGDPTPSWRRNRIEIGVSTLFIATAAFGLWAAIMNYRATQAGTVRRAQARGYLFAFAARDAAILAFYPFLLVALATSPVVLPDGTWAEDPMFWGPLIGLQLGYLVFLFALTYGLLRGQILDLDHKVKLGFGKGMVAAVFLAVAFIATEGAAELFGQRNAWVGIGAGALVFLGIAPLQRLGERIGAKAVPDPRPFTALSKAEKLALYREQVEIAWEDGALAVKERHMLDRLQDKLGLGLEEAARVERAAAP